MPVTVGTAMSVVSWRTCARAFSRGITLAKITPATATITTAAVNDSRTAFRSRETLRGAPISCDPDPASLATELFSISMIFSLCAFLQGPSIRSNSRWSIPAAMHDAEEHRYEEQG